MIDTVHLLINRVCGHNCSLCCNKHYNIKKIPCITNEILSQVHTLCLTGGDPFFINFLLDELVMQIRKEFPNIKDIYAYTSGFYLRCYLSYTQKAASRDNLLINGITISPKNATDWEAVQDMFIHYPLFFSSLPSNRLLVYKEQLDLYHSYIDDRILPSLNMKVLGRTWDKEFKTPDNEGFFRLPILLD